MTKKHPRGKRKSQGWSSVGGGGDGKRGAHIGDIFETRVAPAVDPAVFLEGLKNGPRLISVDILPRYPVQVVKGLQGFRAKDVVPVSPASDHFHEWCDAVERVANRRDSAK